MPFHYVGLEFLLGKGRQVIIDATTDCAEDFVSQVQNAPEMPVDTGTLRGSVHVDSIDVSAFNVTATVATGGEADQYAIFQHEGTSKGVPATKFMEAPLLRETATYRAFMEKAKNDHF